MALCDPKVPAAFQLSAPNGIGL